MSISQRSREFVETIVSARSGLFRRSEPSIVGPSTTPSGHVRLTRQRQTPTPEYQPSTASFPAPGTVVSPNVRITDAPPTKDRYTSMDAVMNRARRLTPSSVGGVPTPPFDPSNPGMTNENIKTARAHVEKLLNWDSNIPTHSDGSIKYGSKKIKKKFKDDATSADATRVARLKEAGIDAKPAKASPKTGTKKAKAARAAHKAHLIEVGRWPER